MAVGAARGDGRGGLDRRKSLSGAPAWTAVVRGTAAGLPDKVDAGLAKWDSLTAALDHEEEAASGPATTPAVLATTPPIVQAAQDPAQSPAPPYAVAAGKAKSPVRLAMLTEPAASVPAGALTASGFETVLFRCPHMQVTNGPPADPDDRVEDYKPFVEVSGVRLAVNPTIGACLASGFGERNGHLHKGVDYHSRTGVAPILAAGDGKVAEAQYRPDYGNMLVIDHGGGVMTRYAHLASFAPGVRVGAPVTAGEQIGMMGQTAAYSIPVHLHYEVLTGDYATAKGTFGMTPRNVFSRQGG